MKNHQRRNKVKSELIVCRKNTKGNYWEERRKRSSSIEWPIVSQSMNTDCTTRSRRRRNIHLHCERTNEQAFAMFNTIMTYWKTAVKAFKQNGFFIIPKVRYLLEYIRTIPNLNLKTFLKLKIVNKRQYMQQKL